MLHVVAFFTIIGLAIIAVRAAEWAAQSADDRKLLIRPKVFIPQDENEDERKTIYRQAPKRHSLN